MKTEISIFCLMYTKDFLQIILWCCGYLVIVPELLYLMDCVLIVKYFKSEDEKILSSLIKTL